MKRQIKKLIAVFYYAPRGRKLRESWAYIQKMQEDPALAHTKFAQFKKSQDNLKELVEIMTETLKDRVINRKSYDDKLKKLLFHPMAGPNDSIHDAEVRKLILRGVEIMEGSKDPLHDISHIYRCMRTARMYFSIYRLKEKLDWGIIATAIAWHDSSRAKNPGFFYDAKLLKPLQIIPFMVDVSVILSARVDAENSVKLFLNETHNYKLDTLFIEQVENGLLATSNHRKSRAEARDNFYGKIISDVDLLDIYTIGRVEASWLNIKENNRRTAQKYINRSFLINGFMKQKHKANLALDESLSIFEFNIHNLDSHAKMFYPKHQEIIGL